MHKAVSGRDSLKVEYIAEIINDVASEHGLNLFQKKDNKKGNLIKRHSPKKDQHTGEAEDAVNSIV